MRVRAAALASFFATFAAHAQAPFTLQQALSAPYALSLVAAPVGARFAWVENAEGIRNVWVAQADQPGGPHEPARPLTHYTDDDAQDLGGLAWSPDGNRLALTRGAESGADGRPANPAHLQRATPLEVLILPLRPDSEPQRVGEGHAPLFRTEFELLFVRNGQIWRYNGLSAAREQPQQLVFDRGSASSLTLSPDGSQLAFVSRRKAHSYIALYTFATHSLRFLGASSGVDSAPGFSRDGRHLAWLREPFTQPGEFDTARTSPNPWSIQLADLATGETHALYTPEANKPGSVIPRFSTGNPRLWFAAGDRVVFASEADGWVHLYSVRGGERPKLLTPGAREIEDATLSRDGSTLLYASNGDGRAADLRHLSRYDLTRDVEMPLTGGDAIATRPQLSADGSTLAALVSDARTPMHAVLVSRSGSMTALHADAVPASYPASRFLTPQQVLLAPASNAEVPLHAQLFLPTARAGKRPALLFFHGGPRRQMLLGYPAMDYYSNAYAMNQYLVSQGYIVLSVNYRCGIGYGLDFRQCESSGAAGASEYADVLAAARYLRSRPDVDTSRIGIWGGSYGGYLTALGLARNSDLFAAGVDFHGVHEWAAEDNASADWLRGSLAGQERIAAIAHAASPMADVSRWRSPVLLIHGDNDPDVAYAQTPMLADALRARSVHVEELIFPDEVHDFLLHRDWLAAYTAAAAFFARTLHPER